MARTIAGSLAVLVGALLAVGSTSASAGDYYWSVVSCGSGSWSSSCWGDTDGGLANLSGAPRPDDHAFLYNPGPTGVTVNFDTNWQGFSSYMSLNATGTGTMTLTQADNAMNIGGLAVGTNSVYALSGGSSTVTGAASIGGTLNQTGGSAWWYESGQVTGVYNLSGGQTHAGAAYGGLFIGGNGTFNQTGGVHAVAGSYESQTIGLQGGIFLDSGGTYNLQDGILLAASNSGTTGIGSISERGGTFNFTGGTLSVGSFIGNLTNNGGTLAPGYHTDQGYPEVQVVSGPGVTTIYGDYAQSKKSTFAVELGGLVSGTDYDVLNVTGTAFLDGLLSVSLLDLGGGAFTPKLGDVFDILGANSLSGTFAKLSLPHLGQGLTWDIDYLTDALGSTDLVRLSVAPIPEPGTYALLLAGLALLGFVFRFRGRSLLPAVAV